MSSPGSVLHARGCRRSGRRGAAAELAAVVMVCGGRGTGAARAVSTADGLPAQRRRGDGRGNDGGGIGRLISSNYELDRCAAP